MNVQIETIGFEQFYKYLGKLSKKAHSIIEKETFKVASDLRNKIAQGMRDTPKDSSNSVLRTKTGLRHYRSFLGNFPAIDSGRLLGSVRVSKVSNGIMLGSIQKDPAYGLFLDQAKAANRRRPWLIDPVKAMIPGMNVEARIFSALKKEL
jgi:hypothetical protein